ncbi:hypothetical protein NSQ20_12050 [Paenibacillus sp. FSL K6-1122]|uniref:hypothetical protein n=1 Tax=Paenibacillus sp. FSL K6-1122 TaxID=2954512 RepID=UPI0030ECEBE0
MNSHYELDKAKVMFKKIFNEDVVNYGFENTRYLKLVNQYGMITGLIQKAIEYADLHLKLQSDSARCGVYVEDDAFIELIQSNYNS